MLFKNFEHHFHESWHSKIQPFIESKECDEIYEYIKTRSKKGHKIAPSSSLTWECFKKTSLSELKVIIVGLCPYHTFSKEGYPVADGLSFSCSITNKLQPSLEEFYNGLEEDLYNGLNLDYYKSPDLSYLAEQGVLLLNMGLTVEKDKPGSHNKIWEPFIEYFFDKVVGYTGIPVILLGKEAHKAERYITPFTHIFKCEHPSFAARNRVLWDTKKSFSKVNQIIKENNNYTIKWLRSQEEIENRNL